MAISRTPKNVPGPKAKEGTKMGQNVPITTVEFFKDVRKPLIRSTPLAVLDHCPRKFLYEYKLGIQPKRYESALTMGTIVHKILQALFMGKEPEEALTVCQHLLAKEQQNLIDAVDPSGFLPTGEALEPALKKVEEDYHKARAIGLVFWKFAPFTKEEYEILYTPWGDPMVEMVLECRYPGIGRPLRCPCDMALVKKGTNEVWIVDYKTTSFDPKIRAIPTQISAQLALYRLVLQTQLDSWEEAKEKPDREPYKVVGSIHAIIKKPGIKLCGKDEKAAKEKNITPFQAYIERLIKWYEEAEAKDPNNPPLILDPNRFTKKAMTKELWNRLRQYSKASNSNPDIDYFYRAGESACLQYNRPCPFMPLCNSDPVMWPDLVRERYMIRFREDEEEINE